MVNILLYSGVLHFVAPDKHVGPFDSYGCSVEKVPFWSGIIFVSQKRERNRALPLQIATHLNGGVNEWHWLYIALPQ